MSSQGQLTNPNYKVSKNEVDKYEKALRSDPRIRAVIDEFAVALGMIRKGNQRLNIPNRPKLAIRPTGASASEVTYDLSIHTQLGIPRRREDETSYADGSDIGPKDAPSSQINPRTGKVYQMDDWEITSGLIDPKTGQRIKK